MAGRSAGLGLCQGLVFGIRQCLLPLISHLCLGLGLISQGLERGRIALLGLGECLLYGSSLGRPEGWLGSCEQRLLLGRRRLLQLRNQALHLLVGLRVSRDLSRGRIELGHERLGIGAGCKCIGINGDKRGELLELLGNRLG